MYNLKNKKMKRKIFYSLVVVFLMLFLFLFNINNNFKTTKTEISGLLNVFELNDVILSLEKELVVIENSDLNLREKSDYFKHRDNFLADIDKLSNLENLLSKNSLRDIRQIKAKINNLTDVKNKILTAFQYDNKENLIKHKEEFSRKIDAIQLDLEGITKDVRDTNQEKAKNINLMVDDGIFSVGLLIFLCLASTVFFICPIGKVIKNEPLEVLQKKKRDR